MKILSRVPEAARFRAAWALARPTLSFLVAWAFIDMTLNLRYPSPEPALWYLLPCADVVLLFAFFSVLAFAGLRLPVTVRVVLVALAVLVRVVRFGDGIQKEYYSQPFSLYTDLPFAFELVRFAQSTLGAWKFALLVVAVPLLILAWCWGLYRAFEHAERYLAESRHVYLTAGVTALAYGGVVLVGRAPEHEKLFSGGFAASATKRLLYEAKFTLNLHGANAAYARKITEAERRLSRSPSNLSRLGGKNVHLILVESYGETVFEREDFARAVAPVLAGWESKLGARGFGFATGLLDAPTYGGRSWLSHATLGTGVKAANQLEYEIVCARKPKTLARYFSAAGYRTVLVQPGTTRAWPKGEFYGFEKKYYAWDFDYRGPTFAWATMPDEYVLDFVGRRELVPRSRPLFVQYTLISSHAPWSEIPVLVDDPESIGDGSIYQKLERLTYPIEWPHFENASEAYLRSIVYDLSVVGRFVERYVSDDALVIVLGDHQPVKEVTRNSSSYGVPVHVLSRDPKLLEPFLARGYARGTLPRVGSPRATLDTFMASLLSDFSTGP